MNRFKMGDTVWLVKPSWLNLSDQAYKHNGKTYQVFNENSDHAYDEWLETLVVAVDSHGFILTKYGLSEYTYDDVMPYYCQEQKCWVHLEILTKEDKEERLEDINACIDDDEDFENE
jgi:hypothetical protein